MTETKKPMKKCSVCEQKFDQSSLFPLMLTRDALWALIKTDIPAPNRNGYICFKDHQDYKTKLLAKVIKDDRGILTNLEKEVLDSLKDNDLLAENINSSYDETLTFGERVADKVSDFGGSWTFICTFFTFLVGWMILNSFILLQDQYDPYPYILLNLILSCLAAVQAPIIMMSQNRRSEKDRLQAENDYKVNLKSELQIRQINAKLDRFMGAQWDHLIEIQQAQADLVNDINDAIRTRP